MGMGEVLYGYCKGTGEVPYGYCLGMGGIPQTYRYPECSYSQPVTHVYTFMTKYSETEWVLFFNHPMSGSLNGRTWIRCCDQLCIFVSALGAGETDKLRKSGMVCQICKSRVRYCMGTSRA